MPQRPRSATLFPYTTLFRSLANSTSLFKRSNREEAAAWSQKPISAGYIGSQLKQIDKTRSSLIISYELENNTEDRKSTRLNSSHLGSSYAVFCLKKKNIPWK